jgi:hypothetical protein
MTCTNNSSMYDELIVPSAAITPAGSFAAARTSTGLLNGQTATFLYEFSGRFSWSNSAGQTTAGMLRETITFHGSSVSCTTNAVPWTAARDTQPRQTNAAPVAGSYSTPQGLHFYVSFHRTTIQDAAFTTAMTCTNNSSMYDDLVIASAAITSAGAFGASPPPTTGILNGQRVTYHYNFHGNFHGIGQNGFVRAAGTLRETITFTGSSVTCTTNDVQWTAQRDIQPSVVLRMRTCHTQQCVQPRSATPGRSRPDCQRTAWLTAAVVLLHRQLLSQAQPVSGSWIATTGPLDHDHHLDIGVSFRLGAILQTGRHHLSRGEPATMINGHGKREKLARY